MYMCFPAEIGLVILSFSKGSPSEVRWKSSRSWAWCGLALPLYPVGLGEALPLLELHSVSPSVSEGYLRSSPAPKFMDSLAL